MKPELDEDKKEKIWSEIIYQIHSATHILQGERTVKMFAEEADIKIDAARTFLDRKVAAGEMQSRFVQDGRNRFKVYSPIIIEK